MEIFGWIMKIEFKVGDTYYIQGVVLGKLCPIKIHIDYVLDSKHTGEKLIVYSFYSKNKQNWIEEMSCDEILSCMVERGERMKCSKV